jgi:hypothetical protein
MRSRLSSPSVWRLANSATEAVRETFKEEKPRIANAFHVIFFNLRWRSAVVSLLHKPAAELIMRRKNAAEAGDFARSTPKTGTRVNKQFLIQFLYFRLHFGNTKASP